MTQSMFPAGREVLSGPERLREKMFPHQREGVAWILQRLVRYRGAILADEAGTGKTLIALSVAATMQREGWCVVAILPVQLISMWRQTAAEFGILLEITTPDSIAIPSSESARRTILIVDEAHRFRNADTARFNALSKYAAESVTLLISATPFCNRARDLQNMLTLMFDDDAFAEIGVASISAAFQYPELDHMVRLLPEIVLRRGRTQLPASMAFERVRRRVIRYRVSEQEGLLRELIGELARTDSTQHAASDLVRQQLERRLDSGLAALRASLLRQRRYCLHARDAAAAGRILRKANFERVFGDFDEVWFQDLLFAERWMPEEADAPVSRVAELSLSLERIDRLLRILDSELDLKRGLLQQQLSRVSKPVLLFTNAIATAVELQQRLSSEWRTSMMTSRFARDPSNRIITCQAMLESLPQSEFDVLVTTDLASEGLNLQNATTVIHYDLPWHPSRAEQREGRVARIGHFGSAAESLYFVSRNASARHVAMILRKKKVARRRLLDNVCEVDVERELFGRLSHVTGGGFVVTGSNAVHAVAGVRICSPGLSRELVVLWDGRFCCDHPVTTRDAVAEIEGLGAILAGPVRDEALEAFSKGCLRMLVSRQRITPRLGQTEFAESHRRRGLRLPESMQRLLARRSRAGVQSGQVGPVDRRPEMHTEFTVELLFGVVPAQWQSAAAAQRGK